jgi:hypothetical protein
MNSVTTKHAGTKAGRFARRALRGVLACALVLGASGAAFAQQYGERQYGDRQQYGEQRRDDPALQQSGRGRFQLPPQDRDPRYDARAMEEQRRMQQQYQEQRQMQESRRGSGRMTADERREMRRQINEAGMDLYPNRR